MTAKFKFAFAATIALIAAPAFAQEADLIDNAALLMHIAGQNTASHAHIENLVLGSAEARLVPRIAAIDALSVIQLSSLEARTLIQLSSFTTEMPMLRRQIPVVLR